MNHFFDIVWDTSCFFLILSNHESTTCGIVTILCGTSPPPSNCMGALLPPFSHGAAAATSARTAPLPPFRTRARAPNRRARRAPQRGLSPSLSPEPPPPSAAAALFLHLSVPARSRSARSLARSFVQSAWVSHSVHTHGRQIKSKWQTRSNSSKVDQAHQDPSPRILVRIPSHAGAR